MYTKTSGLSTCDVVEFDAREIFKALLEFKNPQPRWLVVPEYSYSVFHMRGLPLK